MKNIVKTSGTFMIHGLQADATVPHDRPAVVGDYPHINRAISSGGVKVLGQVPTDVTDEAFVAAYDAAKTEAKDKFDEEAFIKGFVEAATKKTKAAEAK